MHDQGQVSLFESGASACLEMIERAAQKLAAEPVMPTAA